MLEKIGFRRVRRGVGALLGAAVLLAAPAAASAACSAQPVSQVFAPFGDTADYAFVPNGGAESGSKSWSLQSASVQEGNESFFVRGASDHRSVAVNPGGRAVTPYFCLNGEQHPTLRLFVRQPDGDGAPALRISARYFTSQGMKEQQLAVLPGGAYESWRPTPIIGLGTQLEDPDFTTFARIVFDVADGDAAAWSVDDVYLDPWRR